MSAFSKVLPYDNKHVDALSLMPESLTLFILIEIYIYMSIFCHSKKENCLFWKHVQSDYSWPRSLKVPCGVFVVNKLGFIYIQCFLPKPICIKGLTNLLNAFTTSYNIFQAFFETLFTCCGLLLLLSHS